MWIGTNVKILHRNLNAHVEVICLALTSGHAWLSVLVAVLCWADSMHQKPQAMQRAQIPPTAARRYAEMSNSGNTANHSMKSVTSSVSRLLCLVSPGILKLDLFYNTETAGIP